jgi:hypothetical protein
LQNHGVVGLAMNFEQTSAGLLGPFTQWAEDGTWFAGSTVDQAGSSILQGGAGSQSFRSAPVVPSPVTIDFTLTATLGSQFGVTAPAKVTGSFEVPSSFLTQPNGDYGGSNVFDFYMKIGTQVYDQNTAFSPDIQGVRLQNHDIVGLAMNFEQTGAGLLGPFTQWAEDGTWFAGSTVDQAGSSILQGGAGSQSFSEVPGTVPEPSTWAMMLIGFVGLGFLGYRQNTKGQAATV